MRAVCLLLCLALARHTAGHIVGRQRFAPVENLIVQPLRFIDDKYHQLRQNMEEKYQQPDEQRVYQQNEQQYEQGHYLLPRANQNPDSEEQKQYQQSKEQRLYQESQPQYQESKEQREHQQSKEQEENKQSKEEREYGLSKQYEYQQEYKIQKQPRHQKKTGHHSESDSSSSESRESKYRSSESRDNRHKSSESQESKHKSSSSESQESKDRSSESRENRDKYTENRENKYRIKDLTTYGHNKVEKLRNEADKIKRAYNDVITWRGIKFTNSRKYPVQKEDIESIFSDAYNSMSQVSESAKKIFHEAFENSAKTEKEDARLNATEMVKKHNYDVEEHTIKTDDGYYLTMFRMAQKGMSQVQKPVVFLMHGLLGSADDWLLMGPRKSLAYLLADAGYDVWLGNARGNKYALHHVSKHVAQSDFWKFSTDEIALHDLPAMIDYALQTSKQQRMHYVGYSMGTTVFYALTSTRPEYNEKIITMYALSPMVYMANTRSPILRMIAPTSHFHERLYELLGHGQFRPTKDLIQTVGGNMCQKVIGCKHVCSHVNFLMSGVNVKDWDVELIQVVMGHLPAGGSTRQLKQYAKAVASKEFTKYDFGSSNYLVYGSHQPPKYDLQKVRTPVVIYYSEEDWLAHPTDVKKLETELPNVKESNKIPNQGFTNLDFLISKNAPEVIYEKLIASMRNQYVEENKVY